MNCADMEETFAGADADAKLVSMCANLVSGVCRAYRSGVWIKPLLLFLTITKIVILTKLRNSRAKY